MNNERQYWERHAKNYDRSMRLLGKPIPPTLERTVQAVAGAHSVLEVAAGTGLFTIAVAPTVTRLVATDYAQSMVDELRKRTAAHGLTNVECEQADLNALKYPPASFDVVLAANVLHLVPDLPGALSALKAVLRPGGRLIAPTFCHDENFVAATASRLIALTGFPGHRRFTSASLQAAIRGAGFTVSNFATFPGVFPICFVAGSLSEH